MLHAHPAVASKLGTRLIGTASLVDKARMAIWVTNGNACSICRLVPRILVRRITGHVAVRTKVPRIAQARAGSARSPAIARLDTRSAVAATCGIT